MIDVRRVFSDCEKRRRVQRGLAATVVWAKAPDIDQVVTKLATAVLDSFIKNTTVEGRPTELRRYLLRTGNKFGYLCIKSSNTGIAQCRSFDTLQEQMNILEGSVKWCNSFAALVEYVRNHCTSPAYVTRISQLRL